MSTFTGGPFAAHATRILGGKTHVLTMGDSQHSGRVNTPTGNDGFLRVIVPLVRPHYLVGPASNASNEQVMCWTPGFRSAVLSDVTVTSHGSARADFNSGAGTPVLGRETTKLVSTIILDPGDDLGNGNGQAIQWPRQQNSNSTAQSARGYPWPLNNGLNRPWHNGQHIQSRLVIQGMAANGWGSIATATRRIGLTTNTSSAFIQSSLTAADTIQVTNWTAPLADGGGFQTNTSGALNDHIIQCTAQVPEGGIASGLSLIIAAAVVRRCDAAGAIQWNADNTGFGFDSLGRGGASNEDWASNYWSQTQWQAYFTATVLVPDAHATIMIMMGHNVNGTGEQSGSLVTATWSTNYQTIITRLRAAYAAAFPSGTLNIMLIVPWRCTEESNFMNSVAACDSLQVAVETLAASNGCSWFSYYNAFAKEAVMPKLHAETQAHMLRLANSVRDAMDRATNFQFTAGGRTTSGSGWRRRPRT